MSSIIQYDRFIAAPCEEQAEDIENSLSADNSNYSFEVFEEDDALFVIAKANEDSLRSYSGAMIYPSSGKKVVSKLCEFNSGIDNSIQEPVFTEEQVQCPSNSQSIDKNGVINDLEWRTYLINLHLDNEEVAEKLTRRRTSNSYECFDI